MASSLTVTQLSVSMAPLSPLATEEELTSEHSELQTP